MRIYVLTICRKHWPVFFLMAIGLCACVANYTPGTFLSGWDTLHPEFNFPLAFTRAFFGVLRPEQGLGAVAGHSHMADLPHIALLSLLSPFIPLSLLRYAYIFLCFLVGPVGMYFFLKRILNHTSTAFLGSLFYMLNIGTVQLFYVPFEMFATQFALLPFLFLFATDFLLRQNKKALIGFIVTCIFLSPIAFAAPLWYLTFFFFVSYVGTFTFLIGGVGGNGVGGASEGLLLARSPLAEWRRTSTCGMSKRQDPPYTQSSLLIFLMLSLNFYWILPNIYFALVHGKDVTLAASNQLFSEEAFLYNKAFGNFPSLALIHTFYFDWHILTNGSFVQLFAAWKTFHTALIYSIQLLFFLFALVGILQSAIKKHPILLSFFPGILLSLIFLLNDNLPFGSYHLFENIPLFQEALRFPDDKILGIYVFLYTIFFAFGISSFAKILKKHFLTTSYYLLTTALIVFTSFPIFQGQLIHPDMRVHIPQEYFSLFDYMNSLPQGRIATLPIQSLFGWEYYQWPGQDQSFQGSGFLYFGLKDATTNRDFDRWSPANESLYKELSYAVYSQNQPLFASVLHKYDVTYVLLDTSISSPGDPPSVLYFTQLQQLLKTNTVHQLAQFNNHLFVYETTFPSSPVAHTPTLPEKNGTLTASIDTSYLTYGDYVTHAISHFTNFLGQVSFPVVRNAADTFTKDFYQSLVLRPPVNACNSPVFKPTDNTKTVFPSFIAYMSRNGQYCDSITMTTSKKNTPLFLTITSRNVSGLSLRMCVLDTTNGHCILQTKLPATPNFSQTTFSIPPLPTTRLSVNFTNIGIAPTTAMNDIAGITMHAAPATTVIPKVVDANFIPLDADNRNNDTIYEVHQSPSSGIITLSQSYESGWQLFAVPKWTPDVLATTIPFLVGKPIGQHIMVDSWKNGWKINEKVKMKNEKLVIAFLPQYFEYVGFLIAGITVIVLLFYCFIARKPRD